jgi:Fibronectin type III domain
VSGSEWIGKFRILFNHYFLQEKKTTMKKNQRKTIFFLLILLFPLRDSLMAQEKVEMEALEQRTIGSLVLYSSPGSSIASDQLLNLSKSYYDTLKNIFSIHDDFRVEIYLLAKRHWTSTGYPYGFPYSSGMGIYIGAADQDFPDNLAGLADFIQENDIAKGDRASRLCSLLKLPAQSTPSQIKQTLRTNVDFILRYYMTGITAHEMVHVFTKKSNICTSPGWAHEWQAQMGSILDVLPLIGHAEDTELFTIYYALLYEGGLKKGYNFPADAEDRQMGIPSLAQHAWLHALQLQMGLDVETQCGRQTGPNLLAEYAKLTPGANTPLSYKQLIEITGRVCGKNLTAWFLQYGIDPQNDPNRGKASTGNPPLAPGHLRATLQTSGRIWLSWKINGSNAAGFTVERRHEGTHTWAQIALLPAGATSAQDTLHVAPGTNYVYRIRAYNLYGDSGYSNEATATVKPGMKKN